MKKIEKEVMRNNTRSLTGYSELADVNKGQMRTISPLGKQKLSQTPRQSLDRADMGFMENRNMSGGMRSAKSPGVSKGLMSSPLVHSPAGYTEEAGGSGSFMRTVNPAETMGLERANKGITGKRSMAGPLKAASQSLTTKNKLQPIAEIKEGGFGEADSFYQEEEPSYDDLLFYLLQAMYMERLMEEMQMDGINQRNGTRDLLKPVSMLEAMPMEGSMEAFGMEPPEEAQDENEAITYKDLFLSVMEVSYFVDVKIKQTPGEHASLYVKAVLGSEMEENDFHGISDNVSLQYLKNNEAHVLFYGVVDQLYLDRDGDSKILVLTAWGATKQMDISRQKRIFQNPDMTVSQLVDTVMETYQGCDYKINIQNQAIGQLVVQYEETDWEFLKRFLSKYKESLYSDTTYPDIRFEAGLRTYPEDFFWDELPYELSQDLKRFVDMKENGIDTLTASQNTVFEIESYDIASIGNQIVYRNIPWFIESAERYMDHGLLKNRYRLRQKESLMVLPYFNQNITGISIDGTIAGVQRDRVQVDMEISAGNTGGEKYWFPFSTVAASSDGSGWYCMPENGESVRVYFPVDDEKEAYVVTAVKSHEPEAGNESDPMGNPNVRNIQTAQGNQVQFTEEGVVIAAGDSKGSIILKKSGEVVLDALMDINITAVENLNIVAMNELTIKSQESIKIANSAGADMEIKKGKVKFHGLLINEN